MKTYEEVAEKAGLQSPIKERYLAYMKARWNKQSQQEIHCACGYAMEWVERFKNGVEFDCSDAEGQRILKGIK